MLSEPEFRCVVERLSHCDDRAGAFSNRIGCGVLEVVAIPGRVSHRITLQLLWVARWTI